MTGHSSRLPLDIAPHTVASAAASTGAHNGASIAAAIPSAITGVIAPRVTPDLLRGQMVSAGHRPFLVSALLLTVGLAGCATGTWTRDNATQADLDRDTFHCQRESARMYPTLPRQVAYGNGTSVTKSVCKTRGNVETCEERVVAPMTYTEDDNAGPRSQAFDACMRAEGYRYQEGR